MDLTKFYNHDNFMKAVESGYELINNIQSGNELQLYQVGQIVDGSGNGFYKGEIIEVYQENGFFYYVINYKLSERARKAYTQTLRQKDIVLWK